MASMVDRFSSGEVHKPTDLSRKIEVIGSGLGRTGTMSFSAALERLLGGPVYHSGTNVLTDKDSTIKAWSRIFKPSADPEDVHSTLHSLLEGYVSVTDTMGAVFTPELLEMYPDAIVICTIREPAAWFTSWTNMQANSPSPLVMKIILWPVPVFRHLPEAIESLWERFSMHYNISPPTLPTGKEYIQYHHDWLKRIVPPERLHFYDVKEGWEPLCHILKIPVPDEPFPRLNESAAMERLAKEMSRVILFRWSFILGGTLAALGAAIVMSRNLL